MTFRDRVLTTEDYTPEGRIRAVAPSNQAPALDLPKYCVACAEKRWSLRVWDTKKQFAKATRICWRCNSWRHPGECAKRKANQDFSRIQSSLEPIPLSSILFAVLTIDQRAAHGGRDWLDPVTALRGLYGCLSRYIKSLRRRFGMVHYVATVEAHKTGWPHLNVIIVCPRLAAHVRANCQNMRADDLLREIQLRSGFGPVAWYDHCRDRDSLAGYCVKTAGQLLDGIRKLGSEVIKLTQLPLNAPAHFRRIRSSRGFLERARRGSGKRACLVQSSSPEGNEGQRLRAFDEHLQKQGLFLDLRTDRLFDAMTCAGGRLGAWVSKLLAKGWDTLIDRAFVDKETPWLALNYACAVAGWLCFERGPP